jgi:hypothetical protein
VPSQCPGRSRNKDSHEPSFRVVLSLEDKAPPEAVTFFNAWPQLVGHDLDHLAALRGRVSAAMARRWHAGPGAHLSACDRPGVVPDLTCWFVVEPPAGIEPATHPYHGSEARAPRQPVSAQLGRHWRAVVHRDHQLGANPPTDDGRALR